MAEKTRRRRRKPAAAETEILDAAEAFLKERPWREMTVDDVMSRTGLSRPSFYEYFRDRNHLILKLSDRLMTWTDSFGARWLAGEGDTIEELRAVIEKMVAVHTARAHLLRALADAATTDKQVDTAYRVIIERFIDAAGARIHAGVAQGTIKIDHPSEVAIALILMNERYLGEKFGPSTQADPRLVVDTIITIWKRVLFGSQD